MSDKNIPDVRRGDCSLEMMGSYLQPIVGLLEDERVTEIMANQDGRWFYESDGQIKEAQIKCTDEQLSTAIHSVANMQSTPFNEQHPVLDLQLPDGSRLAATMPPITKPGLTVTIRKFPKQRYTMHDLIASSMLSTDLARTLGTLVADGGTFLISGATGSGKTTFLNAMTDYIPDQERLISIEDTRELRISKPNVVAMVCQKVVYSNVAAVSFDDLLKHSLRMRPDRILLGEVRGNEARTLLDSFNTGHGGSLATIHASSASRALNRFADLVMRAYQQSKEDICQEIAASVDYVLQIKRVHDGVKVGRRVTEVIHVTGYDRHENAFQFEPLFTLNHK